MSPIQLECFGAEVLLLNVKDHVAFDNLEFMWNIRVILQNFECSMYVLHFFGNGIFPEARTSASINGQDIVHQLCQRKTILVGLSQVLDVLAFDQGCDGESRFYRT